MEAYSDYVYIVITIVVCCLLPLRISLAISKFNVKLNNYIGHKCKYRVLLL